MIVRHIFAAALIAPFLTASGMAQDVQAVTKHIYVGGPKSDIPHTTRPVSNWEQAYAKAPRAKTGIKAAQIPSCRIVIESSRSL